MVFFTLAEVAIEGTVWITKQLFYLSRYMIWGSPQSPKEIMMETLTEVRDAHLLQYKEELKILEFEQQFKERCIEIERQQMEILNRLKSIENTIKADGSTQKDSTSNTSDD